MLYQLSYLGAAPNAARGERRFIVRPGFPVQPPAGFPGLKSGDRRRGKIHRIQWLPRLSIAARASIWARPHHPHRRCRTPEWRRIRRASDSGRRPGNAPSKTAWRPRPAACRRSGRVSRHARVLRHQLAFNQPKRIGKPSPPISAVVSYSGSPTTFE